MPRRQRPGRRAEPRAEAAPAAGTVLARGVRKQYASGREQLTILAGLDLQLAAGATAVITGASGSGKSTLLNILAGLDNFDAGDVEVAGLRLGTATEPELARYRRRLGLVFQFHHLLRDFDALDNLLVPGLIRGVSRRAAAALARELLAEVGLTERMHHYPAELSGGERQRVAVARALACNPALVLADEPTGNLDERNSALVADLLFALAQSRGVTLVVVTHDPSMSERAQHRYRLTGGVLVGG